MAVERVTAPMRRADEKRIDLVFEGGGVKGNALVGAYSVLEERGFLPQNVAGTSAGAIVATALAAGYTAAEMRTIMQGLEFTRFIDTGWEDRIPVVGKLFSILKDQGIYEGDGFLKWMSELLAEKGVYTFQQLLHDPSEADVRYRYKVQVIASDLTGRCLLVLPKDAHKLGVEPHELNVALAVRMSMSLPIFFEPVRFKNPQTQREHLIVDGGLLSNFPVWLFDTEGIPEWPTFGLRLVEEQPEQPSTENIPAVEVSRNALHTTVEFLKSIIATATQAHDRLYIESANFARTIPIPTIGINTTHFHLSPQEAEALYQSGRQAAEKFLETWDFDAYIAEFRQGKEHSRRREVLQEMKYGAVTG